MMRFVGATAAVRRANGFNHVRFLCTKQDFDISMTLYSFEKEALKRAAEGKNWASSEYGSQYKDLFNVARPIAGPKLGLREAFKPRAKTNRRAVALGTGEYKIPELVFGELKLVDVLFNKQSCSLPSKSRDKCK